MATTLSSILTQVRAQLIEPTADYWSDSELTSIMRLGALDLWGAILDLHQDHYFKINDTDVRIEPNSSWVAGVPQDCFRVTLIEPRDTTVNGSGHQVLMVPRKYNHPDFIVARTSAAADPTQVSGRQIFYQLVGQGSPVEAPKIVVAPLLTSTLYLRVAYNPTIWPDGNNPECNPVPGESDNALKAWTIAYARAKETDNRQPDAAWLMVYGTEKQTCLTRLTPREEQEPEVVDDVFQGYGSIW